MRTIVKGNSPLSKQKGATLITTLVFLLLMTIVSVSAAKISILDILVAGNDQQQMLLSQQTANDLTRLTNVIELYTPIIEKTFDAITGEYILTGSALGLSEMITDKRAKYECEGFDGKAIGVGINQSPCFLYDFQVNAKGVNSGVRDRQNRGAGKEKPSTSINNGIAK